MNINLDQILSRLNSISRMAIIEDAPNTGKMLVSLNKLIKYRYQFVDTLVIAETEVKFAQIICDYYNAQEGPVIEFICDMNTKGLSVIFVPHFSLLSYYYCVLHVVENREKKERLNIQTEYSLLEKELQIKIIMTGNYDMKKISHEAMEYQEDEYVSIKQATNRLCNSGIGEVSIQSDYSRFVILLKLKT